MNAPAEPEKLSLDDIKTEENLAAIKAAVESQEKGGKLYLRARSHIVREVRVNVYGETTAIKDIISNYYDNLIPSEAIYQLLKFFFGEETIVQMGKSFDSLTRDIDVIEELRREENMAILKEQIGIEIEENCVTLPPHLLLTKPRRFKLGIATQSLVIILRNLEFEFNNTGLIELLRRIFPNKKIEERKVDSEIIITEMRKVANKHLWNQAVAVISDMPAITDAFKGILFLISDFRLGIGKVFKELGLKLNSQNVQLLSSFINDKNEPQLTKPLPQWVVEMIKAGKKGALLQEIDENILLRLDVKEPIPDGALFPVRVRVYKKTDEDFSFIESREDRYLNIKELLKLRFKIQITEVFYNDRLQRESSL